MSDQNRGSLSCATRFQLQAAKLVLVVAILCAGGGCSVYMSAKQPDKKDIDLFAEGTPRVLLLEEFGTPASTEVKDGHKVDIFSFVQGYSKGAKASRAVFHGAADILTLGLWEVVGTPAEAVFDGEKMAFEVTYDEKDKVKEAIALNR